MLIFYSVKGFLWDYQYLDTAICLYSIMYIVIDANNIFTRNRSNCPSDEKHFSSEVLFQNNYELSILKLKKYQAVMKSFTQFTTPFFSLFVDLK